MNNNRNKLILNLSSMIRGSFAPYSAAQMEGWTTLGQHPSFCRCLYLIIYMFLKVNYQTRGVVL